MSNLHRPGYIYFILADNGLVKIGRTENITKRVMAIRCGSPVRVRLLHCFEVDDDVSVERSLHRKFRKKRKHGEWFALSDEDIIKIKKYR